jgi:hypothetical protein
MTSPASSGDSPNLPPSDSASKGTNSASSFPIRWDEQEWGTYSKADKLPANDEGINNSFDEAFLDIDDPLECMCKYDGDSDTSPRYVLEEESDIDVEAAEILDEDEPPEDYEGFRGNSYADVDDTDVDDEDNEDEADGSSDDSDGNSGGDDAVIAIPPRKRYLRKVNP